MIRKYWKLIAIVSAVLASILILPGMIKGDLKVDAYKAERKDIVRYVEASGVLEAGDYEELNAPSAQKVLKIYVKENQKVSSGQVLAEFDKGDLEFQMEKLQIARQRLSDELRELEKPTTVSVMQTLKNNMLQAESQYNDMQRKVKDYDDMLKRDKQLYDSGAVSQVEYNSKVSEREGIANQLLQAKIVLENARNAYNDHDKNKSLSINEKKRQIASNASDIEGLSKKIEDGILKSSITGTVTEFQLKEGRVPQTGNIVRIYDLTSFKFKAFIPQEDAAFVKEGQPAYVRLKGLNKKYNAVVSDVKRYASVDKASGSRTPKVSITLELTEVDDSLSSGFDADASIEVGRAAAVIAARRESVRKDKDGKNLIYLIDGGSLAVREIVPGLYDGFMIEVKSGINEGDIIVSSPSESLREGVKVKAQMK